MARTYTPEQLDIAIEVLEKEATYTEKQGWEFLEESLDGQPQMKLPDAVKSANERVKVLKALNATKEILTNIADTLGGDF